MKTVKRNRGFTLIELMVVVVIIGILSAVAMPAYQKYVTESRRADGMSKLNEIMQAQERFFSDRMSYTDKLTELGYGSNSDVESQEGYYQLSAKSCGGGLVDCVLLTAKATGDQAEDGDLTLNNKGHRGGEW